MKLPGEPASVPVARTFLQGVLGERHVDRAVTRTAALLTSEVVTNAVIHAASSVEVRVELAAHSVRVDVVDCAGDCGDGSFPVVEEVGPDEEHGRGLKIVNRLATRWGVAFEERRKSVWFELTC